MTGTESLLSALEAKAEEKTGVTTVTVDRRTFRALVRVARAGQSLHRTWFASGFFGRPHVPDAVELREALEALEAECNV